MAVETLRPGTSSVFVQRLLGHASLATAQEVQRPPGAAWPRAAGTLSIPNRTVDQQRLFEAIRGAHVISEFPVCQAQIGQGIRLPGAVAHAVVDGKRFLKGPKCPGGLARGAVAEPQIDEDVSFCTVVAHPAGHSEGLLEALLRMVSVVERVVRHSQVA